MRMIYLNEDQKIKIQKTIDECQSSKLKLEGLFKMYDEDTATLLGLYNIEPTKPV